MSCIDGLEDQQTAWQFRVWAEGGGQAMNVLAARQLESAQSRPGLETRKIGYEAVSLR